jgi:DNA-binding CsgD family transcriptional regulator
MRAYFPFKLDLSPREKEVVRTFAQGFSVRQTAALLSISEETVKAYLKRARSFYESVNRPAPTRYLLLRRAIEDGLVEPITPRGGADVDS